MGNMSLAVKVMEEALLSRVRPSVKHLILHVTKKCNMRCGHCFVDLDDSGNELSLADIKTIADSLPELIWLDIGGGEPLLRDGLDRIISFFRFKELSIPTNGWDTEAIFEKMAPIHEMTSGNLVVTLSLDGMRRTHDEIRCGGSFDRTERTFKKLKSIAGIRVKFNTVLCEKNYSEIMDLMRFVKDLGADFHSIIMLRGLPRNPSMRLPPPERIRALAGDIYRIQRSYDYGRTGMLSRIQRNYQAYKEDLNLRILEDKKQAIPCLAGRSHAVIWPGGDVSPCELLPPVGNIREKSITEILGGREMQDAIASIRKGNCFCTHDCNMIENILFNPRSYLKLLC